MRRFFIQTFGCQMNVHDSRRIDEVLRARGYEGTDDPAAASLIVFNTCSIRDKADHKLLSAVGRYRERKDQEPNLVLAVAGCLAQQQGEALLDRLDLVDVVIGPDNIAELPELVHHLDDGGTRIARTEFDLLAPSFLTAHVRPGERTACEYVTVMKGCDERCTYCIVPYTRGAERYRAADDIVSEMQGLCAGGVREITLLGQTVNSWHEPGSAVARGTASRFAGLLRRVAREVPELLRVRYTSPHPRHVTPELIAAHAELDMLPAHVHLPVQSGSDRVLRAMLRRYRRAEFLERAHALMQARPGFTLSTDIIVGFPGETEQDFQDTLSLLRETPFSSVFGFKYSPRPHTPALRLGDDVSEEVKSDRLARLFELADELQQRHLSSLVGSEADVLVEGPAKSGDGAPNRFSGRSQRHEIVHIDVPEGVDVSGQLMRVRIERAYKRSLVGVPLSPIAPLMAADPTHARARHVVRLPVMAP
jgi:tRNA-2-methylthio-N6-dimethylallyladenosine synthase